MTKKITRTITVYYGKIGQVKIENEKPYIDEIENIELIATDDKELMKTIDKMYPGYMLISYCCKKYKCSVPIDKFFEIAEVEEIVATEENLEEV